MKKRILITGAGGFIGGYIVEEALRLGYETWAGVRSSTSRDYLQDERIRFINLPFHDPDMLKNKLLEVKKEFGAWDYIVHNLGVTKCEKPADFEKINYGYLAAFARALLDTQTVPQVFVFMSSLGAWGAGDERSYTPIGCEDTPLPQTLYGASKLKAEEYLQSLDGFPYVALRPTGVYGPREKDYLLMMKSIKYGFDFSVGYRQQYITFIYVKDLVKIIFSVIDKGVVRQGFFVSDGFTYTTAQFRQYVARSLGKRWVIPVCLPLVVLRVVCYVTEFVGRITGSITTLNRDKYRIMKQRNWICDVTPLTHHLNFTPDYDLERGIEESVIWYKENGWL